MRAFGELQGGPGVGKGCIKTAAVRSGLSGRAEVRGPSLCPWEQAGGTA